MTFRGTLYTLIFVGALGYGGMKLVTGIKKLQAGHTGSRDSARSSTGLPGTLSENGIGQFIRAKKEDLTKTALDAGISKECLSYVVTLESLDLMAFSSAGFTTTYSQLSQIPNGCVIQDDWIAAVEKNYLQNCFLTNPTKTDVLSDSCVFGVFGLRSVMTRVMFSNKKLTDIESVPVLADLLYAEVAVPELAHETPNYRKMGLIAKQIEKQQTGLTLNERILMMEKIISAIEESKGKTLRSQETIWENVASDFDRARATFNPEDNWSDLQTAVKTHGFEPKATQDYAASLLAANPQDPLGLFLKAFTDWQRGDHEDSFVNLKKAMDLDPKNQNYQRVYENLKNPGAGEETFYLAFRSGITTRDFDK